MMMLLRAVVVAVAVTAAAASEGDSVEVELKQGVIKGVALPAGKSRLYYSFRGIPYAQPPVGKLRFKDPVVAEGWRGVRGPFSPPPCPQINFFSILVQQTWITGEEDCLYLHIYTPRPYESDLPVLVFIHGGGFVFGDCDTAGGSAMPLVTKDVVLVSLQYRLGTLGFMSTEDDVLPGNMGLKDQTLALRWVQDNIHSFGGDPYRVTIFGESAGAASVHYQMFAPQAQGLFQRAIMHSGNSLCPWALRDDHRRVTTSIGKKFGCSGVDDKAGVVNSSALLACLQEVPYEKLVPESIGEGPNPVLYLVPRVDGDFLPAHPAHLLREGRYHKVTVISGVTRDEGVLDALIMLKDTPGGTKVSDLTLAWPLFFGLEEEEKAAQMCTRILYHYLGHGDTPLTGNKDTTEALVKCLSDQVFTVHHETAAMYHAQDATYGHNTYLYQLDHRGQASFTDTYGGDENKEWVSHVDDLQYIFSGVMAFPPLKRPDDLFLSELMVQLWTNFAATGNPTSDLSLGFRWCPASPSNLHYLSLTPAAHMHPDPRDESREFLRSLPTIQNQMLHSDHFTQRYPASSCSHPGPSSCSSCPFCSSSSSCP